MSEIELVLQLLIERRDAVIRDTNARVQQLDELISVLQQAVEKTKQEGGE